MGTNQRINRAIAATFGFLFVVACWPSPLAAQPEIIDPPTFEWTYHPVTANNPEAYYSGVMEIGESTFVIGGATLTTRAYRQAGGSYTIPGPTMHVVPGNKYVLRFHNTLPYEPLNPNHNVFKDPNASNLHTHGLHISGESPGDDVTRSFEGGFGGDFVYDIPADHMGGTYWYHAHHHGSTFLQVSGGAFGLMIVDDSADGIPDNVAQMTERQIVLGYLDPNAAGTGGDTLMSGTLSPTWTVNGVVAGNIITPPDTWQHWRVLVADRDAREKLIEFGPECEVALLARDGVWRTSAPKMLTSNAINLTGASRADLAVRVSAASQLEIDGNVVASITVDGTPDPTVHPFAPGGSGMWSAWRPTYLRDLRTVPDTDVNFDSVSMGARTINGSKWDINVPTFSKIADMAQEWSIGGATNHPFHLHIYHVQALASASDFEAGEYYDVIAANMDVRFDLSSATSSPYDGRAVLHCHILDHEDRGAMGWMDVLGGTPPPTYPLDGDVFPPYSEYYILPETVSPDTLTVITGSVNSGGVSELSQSDDQYLVLDPQFLASRYQLLFTLDSTASTDSPTALAFTLESRMLTFVGTVDQRIELYNYDMGNFEVVDNRLASSTDTVVNISPGGDPTRFVQPVTGAMQARIRYQNSLPYWVTRTASLYLPFRTRVDQAKWTVTP